MEEQKELRLQFRQQQEKYHYYIIALSVTAIGFAIYQTTDDKLDWNHLPAGIAVFSWGLSIYFGLTFLRFIISSLFINDDYLNILQGKDPLVCNHPEKMRYVAEMFENGLQKNSEKAQSYSKWQGRLFYLGTISFLIWHILKMILTSPK